MNSNVPHLRSLVSLSCIEIIVQVRIINLSSVRSNEHMMALLSALCELKLVHFNFRSYNGETVKLHSAVNDDYNNFAGQIKRVPHFRAHNWKLLPKPCACTFTSEQFHWFIQLRKETLQHLARFWRLFRSVMWSRSILVLFYLGVSPSLFVSFFIL